MNIHIDEKRGPSSSPYNDSEYYQYYFKLPNKDGVLTEYMVEVSKSPHHDNDNYVIFVRQKTGENIGKYMYINPAAEYQVNSLPFTEEEARRAVKTYETVQGLEGDAKDTWGDILS